MPNTTEGQAGGQGGGEHKLSPSERGKKGAAIRNAKRSGQLQQQPGQSGQLQQQPPQSNVKTGARGRGSGGQVGLIQELTADWQLHCTNITNTFARYMGNQAVT